MKAETEIKHAELSYQFIGAAMQVHSELGPGQDEQVYHLALREELAHRSIPYRYKPRGRLMHRGILADEFEADLIIDERIIPELKALSVGFAAQHFTQVICYLKYWKKELGILVDFGKERVSSRRIPYTEQDGRFATESVAAKVSALSAGDRDLVRSVIDGIRRVHDEYGLGYRDTTYRGLVRADFKAEGLSFQDSPPAELRYRDAPLGWPLLPCFLLDGRCIVRVEALYDNIHAAQCATLQAYMRHLGAPIGLLVNFGKITTELRIFT